jgi:hypothetical protein
MDVKMLIAIVPTEKRPLCQGKRILTGAKNMLQLYPTKFLCSFCSLVVL